MAAPDPEDGLEDSQHPAPASGDATLLPSLERDGLSTSDDEGSSRRDHAPTSVLPIGAIVGRHLVLQKLGAGGMGVVYAAYDPELDRKVALKVLRPGIGPTDGRARLLREAQALAKLAHPNVVAIHDVGTLGEDVWLAMELVQGRTLGAWLETPRSWREVLGVMLGAGEGLAAAHAVGLLHRDFKPDNVMVADDGRVRVMDFGLARAQVADDPSLDSEGSDTGIGRLALSITRAGALIGTPSYMAPEQLEGAELGEAADQFAFCVTLWQALYGERPFAGEEVMELVANVVEGRRRAPPKGRAVPGALRRACERGLSVDPRQRWPSMTALIEELRRASSTSRRGAWALGVVGGLVLVGAGLARYADIGSRCQGARAQLQGVWDEPRKQEVKTAVLGTALVYAPDTWARVEERLDAHANAWVEKHTEVCEATSVRQEQSAEVMDLRMECLRDQRIALGQAVAVLAEADTTRVENAIELVASLPRPSQCDDVDALRAELPPPDDPEAAAEVEALRDRLAHAGALCIAHEGDEALVEVEAVVELAERLAYTPLVAEALLERSRVEEFVGHYERARADAQRAYVMAVEHGHRVVEMEAASLLVSIVGLREARHEPGLQWGVTALALARNDRAEPGMEAQALHRVAMVLAEKGELVDALDHLHRALDLHEAESGSADVTVAALLDEIGVVLGEQGKLDEALTHFTRALAIQEQAMGSRHPSVAVALAHVGIALAQQGKLDEASAHLARALAIQEQALGPRHPLVAKALNSFGNVLKGQGKLDEALAHYQRALEIRETALGPDHPDVAASLNNIGNVLERQGKLAEALSHHQRALASWERSLGSRHSHVATSLNNLGILLRQLGRSDAALAHYRRALAIYEETLGPRHADVGMMLNNIGNVLVDQGELDEALVHHRRALAIRESALGPEHPEVATSLANVGDVLQAQGVLAEAADHYQRALVVQQAALGPHHDALARPLVRLAEIALERQDLSAAREHAERAVEICEASQASPDVVAASRFVLARALWPDRSARARARALAEAARDALTTLDEPEDAELAEVQAWLAVLPSDG